MPLPLLAHQAPVLPLKLRWPGAWNGTALVLGSIAPDIEYVRATIPTRPLTHSILGQFVFCLPVTLLLVGLVGYLDLGSVLVARVTPRIRPRFAWLLGAATDIARSGGVWRACKAALVGSFSHIGLDKLTHNVLPLWLPASRLELGRIRFTTPAIVQLVASAGCALMSLWLLRAIAERGGTDVPASRPGASLIVALSIAGAGVGVVLARPAIQHPDSYFAAGRLYVWGHVAFVTACGIGAGVVIAGVLLRAWDAREAREISSLSPGSP